MSSLHHKRSQDRLYSNTHIRNTCCRSSGHAPRPPQNHPAPPPPPTSLELPPFVPVTLATTPRPPVRPGRSAKSGGGGTLAEGAEAAELRGTLTELAALRAQLQAAEAAKRTAVDAASAGAAGALEQARDVAVTASESLAELLNAALEAANDGRAECALLRAERSGLQSRLESAEMQLWQAKVEAAGRAAAEAEAVQSAMEAHGALAIERATKEALAASAASAEAARQAAESEAERARHEMQLRPSWMKPMPSVASPLAAGGAAAASDVAAQRAVQRTPLVVVEPPLRGTSLHSGGTWTPTGTIHTLHTRAVDTLAPGSRWSAGEEGGSDGQAAAEADRFLTSYIDVSAARQSPVVAWSSPGAWERAARGALYAAVQGSVLADLLEAAREAFAAWHHFAIVGR